MHTVSAQNLCLAYGDRDILNGASFTMDSSSRIALAGANGSGKSTLMKLTSGLIEPDSGSVQVSRGTVISYLPQSLELRSSSSLYEEAQRAFFRLHDVAKRKEHIEHRLALPDQDASRTAALIRKHDEFQELLLHAGYYDRDRTIYAVLQGLGFTKTDLHRPCREFSGGWQMRISLAKILLESPDFLLLDEPTNYLDIEARLWLHRYLADFNGGVMVVSHDKQFLDDTCSEVFSVFNASLTRFTGKWSSFEQFQREEEARIRKAHALQQQEIKRIEQFIERFRYKDSKAPQVQSRVKYLEKLERIELPAHLHRISFSFPDAPRSGREVLSLHEVGRSYGENNVLSSFSLDIRRGDTVAVTGKNGAGKSTLMRIIAGIDDEHTGEKKTGTGVRIGYYRQDFEDELRGTRSIYDEVAAHVETSLIPSLRGYLGAFLFHGDDIYKPLDVLSGGEKSRVQLVKLLLQPTNLLILDEPTNHLDMMSKEILLEALSSYTGTMVFVSHDLAFIRELADRILWFSPSGPRLFEGDYDYFAWKISHLDESDDAPRRPARSPESGSTQKHLHEDRKRRRNSLKRLQEEEHRIMEKLEAAESRIEEIQHLLTLPEHYRDGEAMKRLKDELDAARQESSRLSSSWHEVTDAIEHTRLHLEELC